VLSELTRLHGLDGRGAFESPDAPPRAEYAVEPVLARLVTAPVVSAQITVDVEQACARAATPPCSPGGHNLLVNCDRHAGAPVTVRALPGGGPAVVGFTRARTSGRARARRAAARVRSGSRRPASGTSVPG
jgi:hypothetical protein